MTRTGRDMICCIQFVLHHILRKDVSVPLCSCTEKKVVLLPVCAMHEMERKKEKKIKMVLIQAIGSTLLSMPV